MRMQTRRPTKQHSFRVYVRDTPPTPALSEPLAPALLRLADTSVSDPLIQECSAAISNNSISNKTYMYVLIMYKLTGGMRLHAVTDSKSGMTIPVRTAGAH